MRDPSDAQQTHEITAFAAELNDDTLEIDLHGMRPDEAHYALEQAVSHAFMQGAPAVRIIHGRGGGALRNIVHQGLRQYTNLVAYFRDAQNTGQLGGVTIAVLHTKSSR